MKGTTPVPKVVDEQRILNFLQMYENGALHDPEDKGPMKALPLMCKAVIDIRAYNKKLLQQLEALTEVAEVASLQRDLAKAEAAVFSKYITNLSHSEQIAEELAPIRAEFAAVLPHEIEPDDDGVCVVCGQDDNPRHVEKQ